jgi:hypothetical protein
MGSNVYLTPLYRAAWADMMAVDARLSPVAVRVGIIIGGYFNSGSASTYVGQKTIAKNMGISARTVWEAVRELITHGYLISTSGGRNSNTYFMPVEKVATYCDIYLKKSRNGLRDLDHKSRNGLRSLSQETSQNSAEISQNRVLNIATGCEQTPILTPFNSKARGTASPDWRQSRDNFRAARADLKASLNDGAAEAGYSITRIEPFADEWQCVRVELARSLGSDINRAWFQDLSVLRIFEGECLMAAPTKFKRDWIADHFAGALLEAWQCVHASISAIQLTVNASSIDQANHVDERSAQGGAA